MKSFKIFAVVAFLIATSAQAKDAPKITKDNIQSKASPSCMVSLNDVATIRFLNVNAILYVEVKEHQSNKLVVGLSNGVETTFTYNSKDDSVTALNKLVKDINTCGQ